MQIAFPKLSAETAQKSKQKILKADDDPENFQLKTLIRLLPQLRYAAQLTHLKPHLFVEKRQKISSMNHYTSDGKHTLYTIREADTGGRHSKKRLFYQQLYLIFTMSSYNSGEYT